MGAFGIWQWIIVLGVVVLLFARPGKISGLMGDFGKGLRSFKTGMKEDEADEDGGEGGGDAVKVIAEEAAPAAPKKAAKKRRAKKASKKAPLKRKTAKKKSAKKKTAKKKTKAKA